MHRNSAGVGLFGRTRVAPSATKPGPPLKSFALHHGSAEIFERAGYVNANLWLQTFGGSHKDFEYYQLIEETLFSHFTYRYLVLLDEQRRAIALQPLILVSQDLSASLGGLVMGIAGRLRTFWPAFFRTRMLLAGCLVGDGKLGLVQTQDSQKASALLAETLNHFAKSERISLITLKDFPVAARKEFTPFRAAGYTRLAGYPSLQLDLNFTTFEQYMDKTLSKVMRKSLRRKLRKAALAAPPIALQVLEDCSDVIAEIYPLYLAVAAKSAVTFEVFTREYFLEAGLRMPGRFRYFVWRQAGKAVAFSFCTVWGDTIYDNDIGLDYTVAHSLNLYYLTFRDIMEWALAHGMKRYCSAPFNYDPKLHLRLQLVPHDLYVRHTSSLMNVLLKWFAPFFAPAKSDPVLRRYFKKVAT